MAIYKVQDPTGRIRRLQGPDGASPDQVIAIAKQLFGGGEGPSVGARRDSGSAGGSFIQFNEDEDATIRELAAGDPQKEEFLRLVPTIEWRGNAEAMRSTRASPKGAVGPYQFMPETADAFGVGNRLDFRQSAAGAAKYYDELKGRYGGRLDAMLADYNGGPIQAKAVMEGRPPPAAETQEYLQLAQKYRAPAQQAAPENPIDALRARIEAIGAEPVDAPGRQERLDEAQLALSDLEGAAQREAPEAAVAQDSALLDRPQKYGQRMQSTQEQQIRAAIDGFRVGGLDLGATFISGAAATPIAGFSGLVAGLTTAVMGGDKNEVIDSAAKWNDRVQGWLTWSPKSQAGQEAAQAIGEIASRYLDPVAVSARDVNSKYTGEYLGPEAAAALETVVLGIPQVFGARVPKLSLLRAPGVRPRVVLGTKKIEGLVDFNFAQAANIRRQAAMDRARIANDIKQRADKLGISLNNDELGDSVVKVAETLAPNVTRSTGMDDIRKAVIDAERKSRKAVDRLYDKARGSGRAFVNSADAKSFGHAEKYRLHQDGFDVLDKDSKNPHLKYVLDTFEGLDTGEIIGSPTLKVAGHSVKTMEIVRKRMNRAIDASKGSERAALIELKANYDKWLDKQYKNALIRGDQKTLAAFKKARKAYGKHVAKYETNKVIRDMLVDDELTPEKVRDLIFGAGAAGLNAQSAQVVKRLKDILGPNNAKLESLRLAVLHDAVVPLFAETPNYTGAARAIDRLMFKNDSLLKELNIDKSDLMTLRSAAHAAKFVKPLAGDKILSRNFMTKAAARLVLGHQIAKAGLKVGLGKRILDVMFGTGKMSEERLLQLFTDAQYKAPIIPRHGPGWGDVLLHGAYADWMTQNEEEKDWADGDF